MSRSSNKTILGIFFLIFVSLIIFIIFSVNTLKTMKNDDLVSSGKSAPIGIIEVEGVILKSKKIVKLLDRAAQDKKIKAIILRVNSPGGAVGPTQEIYEEVLRIDQNIKPVYASFGSTAASGGYYIGAACRKIFSNPGTITGSLGVIMNFVNLEKLMEFLKVKRSVIKAGRYKDIGSSDREMSLEEKKLITDMIDGVHQQFINDILKTRAKKIKGDLKEHAQGQIYSGEGALKIGLVDELKGLYAAARSIHDELKLKEKFGIKYIKEKRKIDWTSFIDTVDTLSNQVKGAVPKISPEGSQLLMFLMD